MNYGTLPSRLLNAIDSLPNARAQMFRAADGWKSISSEEFLRRVAGLSTAFVELGVKPGDRVGLSLPTVPNGIPPILPSRAPAESAFQFILTNRRSASRTFSTTAGRRLFLQLARRKCTSFRPFALNFQNWNKLYSRIAAPICRRIVCAMKH